MPRDGEGESQDNIVSDSLTPATGGPEAGILSRPLVPYTFPTTASDEMEPEKEEDLHNFLSAPKNTTQGLLDLALLPTRRRQRHSPDVVIPWLEDPRDIAPSRASWNADRVPTTPSLRAESLATSGTDTSRLECLRDLANTPGPASESSCSGVRARPSRETSLLAVSSQILDSDLSEWDYTAIGLAYSGTGERHADFSRKFGDDSSLVTVGTCLGMHHPSTISGGYGTKMPPLRILVKMPDEDEFEGFKALQDSGSNVNVMKEDIWNRLGKPRLSRSKYSTIHGLSGSAKVLGCIKLCFFIDGYGDSPFKTIFHVISDGFMGVDALLCGMFVEKLPPRA